MAEEFYPKNFVDEYKHFITTYILPILGITNNNLEDCTETIDIGNHSNVRTKNCITVFSAFQHDFFMLKDVDVSSDNIGLAHNLVEAFTKVSQYRFDGTSKIQIDYSSGGLRKTNYKYAIQKGICDWCAGTDNVKFYELFEELEKWSVKTYEGKKVTLGFIYDPKAQPLYEESDDRFFNWLDFISDDYAATLTDCIHSVIQLDKNCNYVNHLSITKGNVIPEYTLSHLLPYRFAHIIDTEVYGNRVGVFLLNNGDIILSKQRSIKFIKRNYKWLNFSYEAFSNKIRDKLELFTINDELLQQVYASTLDVSLAHTGGIIAVVSDISSITVPEENAILSPFDNILARPSMLELKEGIKKTEQHKSINDKEIDKRILKRKAILSLVNEHSFQTIDRKLRTELISMDGACIIDPNGRFLAIGAIIQNDSGSSGGGRSAAAKKLSQYGFSIKISTDGYIIQHQINDSWPYMHILT